MPLTLSKEQLDQQIELIKQTTGLSPLSPTVISEYFLHVVQFLDERAKLAEDFVSETNSSVFIQQSIQQAENIKTATALIKGETQNIALAIQGNTDKTAVAVTRAEAAADRAELGLIYKGTYNVTTNVPALTAVPNAAWPDGSYLDITPNSGALPFAGENFVSGKIANAGDRLKKLGAQWSHIKASDLAIQGITEFQKFLQNNTSETVLLPTQDIDGRLLQGFTLAGEWFANRIKAGSIPDAALGPLNIEMNDLSPAVSNLFWKVLDPGSGYLLGLLDEDGRKLIMIKTTGGVEIPRFEFTFLDGSIAQSKLDSATQAKLDAGGVVNIYDRALSEDDGLVRARYVDVAVKTSYNGSMFAPFPRVRTPSIQGLNTSGTILEFRKSNGFLFRGKMYMGLFTPSVVSELSYKGEITSAPATAGRIQGDYYRIGAPEAATLTINGVVYYSGDLAVFDAGTSNFVKKSAPSPTVTAKVGHFWIVDTAGTFDGLTYTAGDIIYMESRKANGGPNFRIYKKQVEGEFFFAGSFTPASFVPPTALANNLVYIAAAAGTFDSKIFAKNDLLLRAGGIWHIITGEQVISVASGAFFSFKCDFSDLYEVRRADLSNVQVGVLTKGKQAFLQKNSIDNIIARGDSMIGSLSALAALMAPRTVTTIAYGGGTSEDIASMIELEARTTDLYRGWFNIFYHGQNNLGDLAQIIEYATRMLSMKGARDNRFLFITVLGDRYPSYTGGRMVLPNQEGAFNNVTGNQLTAVEQYYEKAYPGNYVNIRKELLAAAVTMTEPDLLMPGMTQAQSAATYGHVPLSFFLDYTTLPYSASQLTFSGYHSLETAPSGGVDKNYYISTFGSSNSQLGSFWVNVAGIWTYYSYDRVHTNAASKSPYATAIKNWFTLNKQ